MSTNHTRGVTGRASLPIGRLDAVVFDMDGVVTDTATLHARSWKRVFDDLLRSRAEASGAPFRPFEPTDYLQFVDGKPRDAGAASFLASRGISLDPGHPSDPPGHGSICSIANLKDQEFERQVTSGGVRPYPSTVAFIAGIRSRGLRTALITSSRHGRAILQLAGVSDAFDVIVDGVDGDREHLAGKPDPAIFLAAASLLGVAPGRAAVVEDALAGVEAGRNGQFGVVVGVDRGAGADALLAHGADMVVSDLAELDLGAAVTGGRP
jgi:alpha,alpha-trehalase